MGRWRPPPEKSTALITRDGHERLKRELDELWRQRRPEVVRALAAAAAEGDRSENAEYTYRKKQLAEIDRRVRYLSKRLEQLRVVDEAPSDPDAVFFGARVELENAATGEVHHYRIVGPDETDARDGLISIDSPLARALLRKRLDDEVEAMLPAGPVTFVIADVSYADDTAAQR
ncbi:transcription elongation factor GreB [Luteimonas yindakuii]|uniref:Transcription elongation factor GreB n=1 Tax=Luteimonas yindakuii TaxID=2565782 RepID=A0A4Z1R6U3_9GAMM|nr:transcription elongation factor GreB [Luteimonas yindakuii]TKS54265.1 transcription elongation factor GreB [Luteimonas yindakuii]